MRLNIKNDKTCRLALELAELTGESMSNVIQAALREKLERERRLRGRTGIADRLMALGRRSARLAR